MADAPSHVTVLSARQALQAARAKAERGVVHCVCPIFLACSCGGEARVVALGRVDMATAGWMVVDE